MQGLGKKRNGLYNLVNVPLHQIDQRLSSMIVSTINDTCLFSMSSKSIRDGCTSAAMLSYSLWHHRLGHVSYSKLKHIPCVPPSVIKNNVDTCLSCPMAKFTKLPYSYSDSLSSTVFELLHIDIRGPYKVPTQGKFRDFLTDVDDCSRATSIYLLVHKK